MTDSTPQGIVSRIVRWLRAGYPEGVPSADYVALLGILRRSLTSSELDRVVDELSAQAETSGPILTKAEVEKQIEAVLLGPAAEQDVARVSTRLVRAGWPLADPGEAEPGEADQVARSGGDVRAGLVQRVVSWLREGYPAGLPENDFVPLVALLRRRLSDEELGSVASGLSRAGAIAPSRVDVGHAIANVTSELPSESEIARVRSYLVEHGWPVDFDI